MTRGCLRSSRRVTDENAPRAIRAIFKSLDCNNKYLKVEYN